MEITHKLVVEPVHVSASARVQLEFLLKTVFQLCLPLVQLVISYHQHLLQIFWLLARFAPRNPTRTLPLTPRGAFGPLARFLLSRIKLKQILPAITIFAKNPDACIVLRGFKVCFSGY